jgi:hypothetical protein
MPAIAFAWLLAASFYGETHVAAFKTREACVEAQQTAERSMQQDGDDDGDLVSDCVQVPVPLRTPGEVL